MNEWHAFSSGCPEGGTDNAEVRGEFVDKLTKARNAVPAGSALNSIFSAPVLDKTVCYYSDDGPVCVSVKKTCFRMIHCPDVLKMHKGRLPSHISQ